MIEIQQRIDALEPSGVTTWFPVPDSEWGQTLPGLFLHVSKVYVHPFVSALQLHTWKFLHVKAVAVHVWVFGSEKGFKLILFYKLCCCEPHYSSRMYQVKVCIIGAKQSLNGFGLSKRAGRVGTWFFGTPMSLPEHVTHTSAIWMHRWSK